MAQQNRRVGKLFGGALVLSSSLILFIACGSTESSGPTDGGAPDVAVQKEAATVMDTSMPVVDSATCDLSTDLTTSIPDAAIDDGGTRSTGLCLACVNQPATCKMYVDQCNMNCECKGIAGPVLQCIAAGGALTTCGAMALSVGPDAQQIGLGLLTCVQNNCAKECIPAALMEGGASDGSTDGSDTDGSDM
jgi:hypothetical protein